MREKGAGLSVEDKLEIRSLYRNKTMTQADIAEKFNKSRQTINAVCMDESLEILDAKIIDKEIDSIKTNILRRSKNIRDRVLTKIEQNLGNEKDLRKLTPLLKELNNSIQLLQNRPTEIKEVKQIKIDANKLVEQLQGNPEDISSYLLGDRKATDIVKEEK